MIALLITCQVHHKRSLGQGVGRLRVIAMLLDDLVLQTVHGLGQDH